LAEWFFCGEAGSLETYPAGFEHTIAVVQSAPAIERAAYEAGIDLLRTLRSRTEVFAISARWLPQCGTGNCRWRCAQPRTSILSASALPTARSACFHRGGCNVTFNTDNRLMSRVSLTDEFAFAVDHHGFTLQDLRKVTEAAANAAFVD
jgi:hypothetical protein